MDPNHGDHDGLPDRLRNLIRLGCALAVEADERIPGCVADCLTTGATRAEIMEILHTAVIMAEIRVDKYTAIVSGAIDRFGCAHRKGGDCSC